MFLTHLHSVYSLSDSLITTSKLVKRLNELNMKKVAITDHGNLLHIQEFRKALKNNNISHFPGCEFYFTDDINNKEQRKSYHLTVIAKTEQGVKNLYTLSSLSYEKGFHYRPRIDFNLLKEYNEGLVVSSACLKGKLDCLLLEGKCLEALKHAQDMKNILGDRFFIEIMPHNIEEQQKVNPLLIELAQKLGIKIITTCDSHYAYQDEAENRRMLLMMNKAGWAKDEEVGGCNTIYMMSPDEMKNTFNIYHSNIDKKVIDEAVDNTELVLDGDAPNVEFDKARFPIFEISKQYNNTKEYFNNLIINGLKEKNLLDKKEYVERALSEAKIITDSGFYDYFLVMQDIFKWCKENNVYCGPARGCFLPGNKVHVKIGCHTDIKRKKKIIKDYAYTHDGTFHKILDHYEYNVKDEDCIRLFLSNGKKIECTSDHKIFKKDFGFIEAKELKIGDILLGAKTRNQKVEVTCCDCGKKYIITAKGVWKKIHEGSSIRKPGEILCLKCNNKRMANDPILKERVIMRGANANKRQEVREKMSKKLKYLAETTDFKKKIGEGVRRAYKKDPTIINRIKEGLKRSIKNDPSIIDRMVGKKNRYKNGNFYSLKNNCNIFYQSSYELKALNIWENDSNIVSFIRPKLVLSYINDNNVEHLYKPDFLLLYKDGHKELIEIKSNWKRNNKDTILKEQAAIQYCKQNNLQYYILTEKELKIQNDLVHNEIEIINIEKFKYTGKVYDIKVEGVHNYSISGVTVHNSSGGSLVAYLLGITRIDPLKYDLLFGRFYNEGRNTGTAENAPDIDSDFESARREEVIKHVEQKYGFENVSQICSISYIKLKSGIKDVCRALNISIDIANKISQDVPWEDYEDLDQAMLKDEKARQYVEKYPELFKYVRIFCGIPRQTGKHAAGIVIGDEKIGNICPMMLATVNGEKFLVSQFDKDSIKHTGLIKYDFLGLTTMDFIKALDIEIEKETGHKVNWDNIDLNDEKVYDNIFTTADTEYIFQCDSQLVKTWLKKMKCKNIEDLSAVNTLIRPASLISGATDRYIKKRFGDVEFNKVECEADQIFNDITKDTCNEIIYDEQKMKMVQQIGGLTLKDANIVRKAVEKWADKHDNLQNTFIENAIKKGWNSDKAKLYWEMVKQYSFCKAHSIAYSILGFWCAWAKYYHPIAFMKAMFMISSTDSSADKFNVIDAIKFAFRLGYKVLPVNINKSKSFFTFDDEKKEVYFPFRSIKGISEDAGKIIEKFAPFVDFDDFLLRTKSKEINKRVLMPLIELKAFDDLNCKQQIFKYYLDNFNLSKEDDKALRNDIKVNKNAKLLTKEERVIYKNKINEAAQKEFDKIYNSPLFMFELKHLGIILSSDTSKYSEQIKPIDINTVSNKQKFLIYGFLTEMKSIKNKKGNYYGFIKLVDQNFVTYEIITRSITIDNINQRDMYKLSIGQYVKAEVTKSGDRFFLEKENIIALDDCI